jgi:hypothetical protein
MRALGSTRALVSVHDVRTAASDAAAPCRKPTPDRGIRCAPHAVQGMT